MAKSCKEYIVLAEAMIESGRPYSDVQKVLEIVRDRLMLGVANLTTDEYYRFCKHYGNICFYLDRMAEAEYFLKRAVSIAMTMHDLKGVSDPIAFILHAQFLDNRISEAISTGEKYLSICSGHECVYDIMTSLCFVYRCRNWNIKAQVLAKKVLNHSKRTGIGHYKEIICCLYKFSYNDGRCKNREGLLSDWYDTEICVNGMKSSTAMEVLAEKAMVIALKDKARIPEAVRLLDEAIPVLEKNELIYCLEDLPHIYAFQAAMKAEIGEMDVARMYFAKAKANVLDPDGAGKEYLTLIEKSESEIEKSCSDDEYKSVNRE